MSITAFPHRFDVCALAARLAKLPAKNGTASMKMASIGAAYSYDNTGARRRFDLASREIRGASARAPDSEEMRRRTASWTFSSDVCKHCENAGCLEACPTGSIVRTEFGGVYVQPDICNGCGYCVVAAHSAWCERNPDDGRAFKCTFCYDRQKVGLTPACAKACPTESIKFGEIESLKFRAKERVEELHTRGMEDANLYDPRIPVSAARTQCSSFAAIRAATTFLRKPKCQRSI